MPQIALGTVQFGLNYGISNTNGQIRLGESRKILEYAKNNNITVLDTATAYGDSESVLGKLLSEKEKNSFKIVTKVPECAKSRIESHFYDSLKKLKCNSIYGVLFHSYQALISDFSKWKILLQLKSIGKISKIGISLYHPSEWLELKEKKILPDILQFPFNIFDQRFLPYLNEIKELGIEIHVRSVFLQGLFFMNPEKLSDFFSPVKVELNNLKMFSEQRNISITSLCLSFVKAFEEFDYIILGIDKIEQLQENIKYFNSNENDLAIIKTELLKMNIKDERMVLPYLWPKRS